ncbi:uncharacterized protein V6R79_003968 [Siganus canaliculatus]
MPPLMAKKKTRSPQAELQSEDVAFKDSVRSQNSSDCCNKNPCAELRPHARRSSRKKRGQLVPDPAKRRLTVLNLVQREMTRAGNDAALSFWKGILVKIGKKT